MIKITRDNEILAEQTTDHPNSSYGSPVLVIHDESPEPGPATIILEDDSFQIEIIGEKAGWLVAKDERGFLIGVIWSDGSFFADNIVDESGSFATELSDGCQVRGTLPIGELGSVFF